MKPKNFFKSILLLPMIFMVACSTFIGPSPTPTFTLEEGLATALAEIEALSTANPDGHLHEIMQKNGVTLTAREVQYNMSNKVDKEFGLSGDAELCDYYNWGYDESIEKVAFCAEVTPSGGYTERWYIYFSREKFSALYQDLLEL